MEEANFDDENKLLKRFRIFVVLTVNRNHTITKQTKKKKKTKGHKMSDFHPTCSHNYKFLEVSMAMSFANFRAVAVTVHIGMGLWVGVPKWGDLTRLQKVPPFAFSSDISDPK